MVIQKLNEILYMAEKDDIDHTISRYIKSHIDKISEMSIEELAKACFVSKAKISKFCRMIGYENYIAFKDACRIEVQARNATVRDLHKKYTLDRSMEILQANLVQLDLIELIELSEQITQASTVYLFGSGYSNLLARILQFDLDLMNIPTVLLDEGLSKEYHVTGDDLLIVLSVVGSGLQHNLRRLNRLEHISCRTWLVATEKAFPFASSFSYSLLVPCRECDLRLCRLLMDHLIAMLSTYFTNHEI